MNLILVTRNRGRARQIDLKMPLPLACISVAATIVVGLMFVAGYQFAAVTGVMDPDERVAEWQSELQRQSELVDATRREAQENLNALAVRLGQMNAHVIRLDALGERLTHMADLDDGEFDFSSPPPLGGPEEPVMSEAVEMPNVFGLLDDLREQVNNRAIQLGVLENLLMNRNLSKQVEPEGRPVKSGWISSYFGNRTDPFTGRPAFHRGVDFAGKEGAEVTAVAAGVVVWSGPRYGFGELVEINHGNGYVTRYAHNFENLVSVGEAVKKGQVVATMGSTGRATGPNLHFEVLQNNERANPLKYIRDAK